jgi:fatty acid desaturase
MAAISQVRPFELFDDATWAGLTTRSPWRGLALVAHAWGVILAANAVAILWPNPVTILGAIIVIGARQLGLTILMHDAAHGLLHPDTAVNAFVGEYICAAPVGADLARYRPYHLQHHRFTQQPEDPDLVLSKPFPTTRASLRRKIIRDLTGQTFFKQRIGPFLDKTPQANAFIAGAAPALRRFALANLLLLGGYTVLGLAPWFILLWIVPMATWLPLVTRIRNIAEHACTSTDNNPYTVARTTKANALERALIAPYNVQYHAEHHLFLAVPCYRLPALHAQLARLGLTQRMTLADGYRQVLRHVAPA